MDKKRLNIAQITPYFYPVTGGIEKATYETAKRLVKKGHRVTVYTSASYNDFTRFNVLPRLEFFEGIRIKRFPEFFNISGAWFPKIDHDEEILHFRSYCINPHTYLLKKFYGRKPIVITCHGGFSREKNDFKPSFSFYGMGKFFWQYLFGRRYLKKIDKLIALHGWERNNLIFKGANEKDVEIIPNGIGEEAFEKYDPIIFDKPYILSLCRIAKVKSLDHVVKILPKIKDIYYVIAGGDVGEGEIKRIKKLANELDVLDRVKFVGEIRGEEKYRYISGAMAVVVPSQWEMLSHTILESMAQEKIVIASNSYGNPFIIDNNENGIIYNYGDLNSLSDILKDVLYNKNKYLHLGIKARKKLSDNYRWDSIVEKIENIYINLQKK